MAKHKPGYLKLLENGELKHRVEEAKKHLTEGNLCPHELGSTEGKQ